MEKKKNPAVLKDDQLFTSLLSSAYSLQQQHDKIRSTLPAPKFNAIIAEVVDTQSLIRKRDLDPDTAMHLIAKRTQKLSGAAGAAIALATGEVLDYKVGSGIAAMLPGVKLRADESVSFVRLQCGQVVETDSWQDPALATRLLGKVLSAPIFRHGTLAGCIQVFSKHGRFDSDAIYICELMAGVVSHLIGIAPGSGGDESQPKPHIPRKGPPSDAMTIEGLGQNMKQGPLTGSYPELATELESQLKNPAISAKRLDGQIAAAEAPNPQVNSANSSTGKGHADAAPNESDQFPNIDTFLRQLDQSHAYSKQAQRGQIATSSKLAPSDGNPTSSAGEQPHNMEDKIASFGFSDVIVPNGSRVKHQAESSQESANRSTAHKTRPRLRRLIYPILVLLFVISIRINAVPNGWPLESVTYILFLFTTWELLTRLSNP